MGMVALSMPGSSSEPPKTFTFDSVFPPNTEQERIYQATAMPICDSVMEGYNGTIFAYGQTGTGKTFTMEGENDPPELRGIIPRAFAQVFEQIASRGDEATEFLVRASYLEIYNEDVRDLLSKQAHSRLDLKETPESGVYVKDLTSYVVKSTRECDKLRDFGAKNRHTGATAMNQDSSRSHSIYTITVESCETRADGSSSIKMGKLNLVDLAGSERQSKTQATGDRLKEATKINLSLSALGNCISALVDGKSTHIPFRDSKLTRLLQSSLGGNCKAAIVVTVRSEKPNVEECINTLRFAQRAKSVQATVVKVEDMRKPQGGAAWISRRCAIAAATVAGCSAFPPTHRSMQSRPGESGGCCITRRVSQPSALSTHRSLMSMTLRSSTTQASVACLASVGVCGAGMLRYYRRRTTSDDVQRGLCYAVASAQTGALMGLSCSASSVSAATRSRPLRRRLTQRRPRFMVTRSTRQLRIAKTGPSGGYASGCSSTIRGPIQSLLGLKMPILVQTNVPRLRRESVARQLGCATTQTRLKLAPSPQAQARVVGAGC